MMSRRGYGGFGAGWIIGSMMGGSGSSGSGWSGGGGGGFGGFGGGGGGGGGASGGWQILFKVSIEENFCKAILICEWLYNFVYGIQEVVVAVFELILNHNQYLENEQTHPVPFVFNVCIDSLLTESLFCLSAI